MSLGKKMLAALCTSSLLFSGHPILDHALPRLSDYGFFQEPMKNQVPIDGILPFTIASPLFSDYAEKLRFIQVPDQTSISHTAEHTFNFPAGTFLIKTFYYPSDFRKPDGARRLIETRLLKKTETEWLAMPYVWNAEQTEAVLALAGDRTDVSWIHGNGKAMNVLYSIPNMNQCKSCHVYNNIQQPIGPKVRNLNLDFVYDDGTMNQLEKWVSSGILEPLPELKSLPRTVNYSDNFDGTLDNRARAWLDINCAHCHRRGGPAETSGLYLDLEETYPTALGVNKPPVAAGRGAGDRMYTIVPGHPELSIMDFRIRSTDPGIMMPELSRKLVHTEGVELIQAWIREMPEVK